MAGHVDDVVDAAGDPVITVGVAAAAVAGEVLALVGREIGLLEALVIAIDRAHLPRPTVGDAQIAARRAFLRLAFGVDNLRLDAEEWPRRRARFELGRARQRRDQDAAGLGLPPGVDDRTAAVADHTVIPLPGFRIDRLADRAEQPERGARRLFYRRGAAPPQRAGGGRGGVGGVG